MLLNSVTVYSFFLYHSLLCFLIILSCCILFIANFVFLFKEENLLKSKGMEVSTASIAVENDLGDKSETKTADNFSQGWVKKLITFKLLHIIKCALEN